MSSLDSESATSSTPSTHSPQRLKAAPVDSERVKKDDDDQATLPDLEEIIPKQPENDEKHQQEVGKLIIHSDRPPTADTVGFE
jgi:hypothetical protein